MVATQKQKSRILTIYDLEARASRSESGCLEWGGTLTAGGYGRLWFAGKDWRAHRLSWTMVHGPIAPGLYVCHRCDNPKCMAVEHLFLGTPADNSRDMDEKGRRAPAAKGQQSPVSKLTRKGALHLLRIRESSGASIRALARLSGMSKSQVHRVITGEQWAHLQEATDGK